MIGREWYYYFLPGAVAALLAIWLLYERLRPASAASPASAAAAEEPRAEGAADVVAAEPTAVAPAPMSGAAEAKSSATAPARSVGGTTVARLAKGHVVLTPTEKSADEGAAGEGAETVEGFVTSVKDMSDGPGEPKTDFRPCEVYFTDSVKACDENEFKYHVAYYEEKLNKINTAVSARGGVPNDAENDLILKYTRMIKDYQKFPNAQFCKLKMPNWEQRTADKQAPIISKTDRNDNRGPVEHWAYCWRNHATTTPAGLAKTGMLIDQVGGKPTGVTFSGAFYVRGKFDESISPAGAVKTYCHESSGAVPEYKIKTALVIRNALKGPRQTKYVKNNADAPVRDWDSDTYFRDQLFRENAATTGNRDVVTAQALVRAVRLVKIAKDPCGRVVEHYSTSARVQFTANIQLASTTLGSGDDYLAGRTTDLTARISSHKATALGKRKEIAGFDIDLRQLETSLANNKTLQSQSQSRLAQRKTDLENCRKNPPWVDSLVVRLYPEANYGGGVGRYPPGRHERINATASSLIVGKGVDVFLYAPQYRNWTHHYAVRVGHCSRPWWLFGHCQWSYTYEARSEPRSERIADHQIRINGPADIPDLAKSHSNFNNSIYMIDVTQTAAGRLIDRCETELNNYNSENNTYTNKSLDVINDTNKVNDMKAKIAGLWAEVNRYDREVKMMESRYADMREAMRSGIERLLSEGKLNLMIDDDAAEKYKYLSYDESYIMEL